MSDEKRMGGRVGPYRLGEPFKSVGPGPGPGQLYLGHHVRTGARVLVLLPRERGGWMSRGPWQVRISGRKEPSSVEVALEETSAPVEAGEVADALRLLTQAVSRVEDQSGLYTRLMAGPVARHERWRWALGRLWRSRGVRLAALLGAGVLGLVLGRFWLP